MSRFKTPLRYPGGKQRLTPFILDILRKNEVQGNYIEPYAGGAGVAIELLLDKHIQNIHLNDASPSIYAFWYSVKNHPEDLCRLISRASLTVEEWKRRRTIVREGDTTDLLELGFSAFFLNRCNRSGVLSAGIIGGLKQDGQYKMDARFSRTRLIQRIEAIALFRQKIFVTNFDASDYITSYIPNLPDDSLVYFDPPYYVKGGTLYLNSYKPEDHQQLAHLIQGEMTHKWILSYDGVPQIINMYNHRRNFLYDLQYSAGLSQKGKEIFVFGDTVHLPEHCSLENVNEGLINMAVSV